MDSFTERRAAMLELKVHCDELERRYGPLQVSEQTLTEYVQSTSKISLPPQERLVYFSGYLDNDWRRLSQLFSYILEHYRSDDPSSVLAMWISLGIQIMSDLNNFSEEHRILVATELGELIKRAQAENESGFAFLSGLYYYSHPLRQNDEQENLKRAIYWWEKAIQQKIEEDELDSYSVCHLAHAYFELGDFRRALEWYKHTDLDQMEKEGKFGQLFVRERINACKDSLT